VGWTKWVPFPLGVGIFLLLRFQFSSWAEAASYLVGMEGCFPGGNAVVA